MRDQNKRADTTRDQSDSPRPSRPTSVTGLLALQRMAGNTAVTRAVQAKCQSHDADHDHGQPVRQPTAYDVLRSTNRPLATSLPAEIEARFGGADPIAVPRYTDAGAQRSVPDVQRSVSNDTSAGLLEQAPHQHNADWGHQAKTATVQRSTVHDVLHGPGRPIDTTLRQEMEARLDADFSDVRLHTGVTARRSATQIGARAHTLGNNIVIGDGGTDKHTLAHELTHVIQQRQGPVAGTDYGNGLAISSPDDHFELEAEKSAHKALSGPARKTHTNENVVERASAGPSGGTGGPAMSVQRATAASPGTIIQRARYKKDENGQLVPDGQGGFAMEEEQASDRISAVLRPGEAPQPMTETQAREWLRRGVDEDTRKRYDGVTGQVSCGVDS